MTINRECSRIVSPCYLVSRLSFLALSATAILTVSRCHFSHLLPLYTKIHYIFSQHLMHQNIYAYKRYTASRGFSATVRFRVSVLSFASSRNSSVYLWRSSRSTVHTFVFDSVDAVHMLYEGVPSFALQQRANTLLNFYCNAYDVAAADEQRCCAERRA